MAILVDGKMLLIISGFVHNKLDYSLSQSIHIKIPEIVSYMEKSLNSKI